MNRELFPDPAEYVFWRDRAEKGFKLPKLKIGKFIRKNIGKVIPGAGEVAEKINNALKTVKGTKSQGPAAVYAASAAAISDMNREEAKKKMIMYAAIAGGILLLVYLARRR